MSDWSSSKRIPLRSVVIAVVVVCCAAALFFAGRWSAPTTVETGRGGDGAASTVRMLPVDEQGLPFGYAHTEAGARAAAINVVVAGLWLRRGFASSALNDLLARGLSAESYPLSPATRMLLNKDTQTCGSLDGEPATCGGGGHESNPQTAIYDFAPPTSKAGILAEASIETKPTVTLSEAGDRASVRLRWAERRTSVDGARRMPELVTDFTLRLAWWQGDWKLLPNGVDASPAGANAAPGTWLTVLGFVGQEQ